MKKTLATLALAGGIGLAGVNCARYSYYKFNGIIDNEKIHFQEEVYHLLDNKSILTVKKSDGRIIKYTDSIGDDLRIESVEITDSLGITEKYNINDLSGKPVVEKAQKQFDEYLKKIKETKINRGLKLLR